MYIHYILGSGFRLAFGLGLEQGLHKLVDHLNWSFDSYENKDLERDRGRALYSAFAKAVDWDSDRDSHKDFDRAA